MTTPDSPTPPRDPRYPDYEPQTKRQHLMGTREFLVLIGVLTNAALVLGQVLAWAIPVHRIMPSSLWALGVFVPAGALIMLAGIEVARANEEAITSLIGLLISALGLGLCLAAWPEGVGLTLQRVATGFGAGVLMITFTAWLRPTLVAAFGSFLAGTLPLLVLVLIGPALPPFAQIQWWQVPVIAGLLLFYDGYLTRALELMRTPGNAIDTAAALYMDGIDKLIRALTRT